MAADQFDRDDVEAVAACLGDDAAQLRQENDEDERAANMDRAASMLTWMLLTHPAYTIDTADHVLHGPTGETWVVARVSGEHLYPCGWPPTRADLKDCTVVKAATAEERAQLLRELSQGQTEHAGWAADRLGSKDGL